MLPYCFHTDFKTMQPFFTMPHLRVVKSKRIKEIPTKNPYPYASTVEPIYEVHRVLHSEMVELCCR